MGLSLVDCLWYGYNNEYWSWPKLSWNLSRNFFPKLSMYSIIQWTLWAAATKFTQLPLLSCGKKTTNQTQRTRTVHWVCRSSLCFASYSYAGGEKNWIKNSSKVKIKADYWDCASPGVVNKSRESHINRIRLYEYLAYLLNWVFRRQHALCSLWYASMYKNQITPARPL